MFKILRILLKNLNFLFFILFFPLYLIIIFFVIMVKPLVTIRFAVLRSDRIGHLAIESELYLLRQKTKARKDLSIDIMTCSGKVSNIFLKKKISNKLTFVPRILIYPIIIILRQIKLNAHLIPRTETFPKDYSNLLDKYECSFKLTQKEELDGEQTLKRLGINKDEKFVCINSRDDGYFKDNKNIDFSYHSYRNVDIELFKKVAQYLTKKGIKVIRVGKNPEKKISFANDNIIDYSSSALRSDFMDLYLVSKSYFYIGAGGGLDVLPLLFRTPKLTTNLVPIIGVSAECKNVMTIFKHHFSTKLNKKLSIKEITENNLDTCYHADEFIKKNIQLINNSSEELINAAEDMIMKINKKLIFNENEKRQQEKFWSSFPLDKKNADKIPLHGNVSGLIAPSFLEKNKYLLN